MKRKNCLIAGLLCAILVVAVLSVSAYAQGNIPVCPYEDCTMAGRHLHDDVAYCGYAQGQYCDGSCAVVACPYEDCTIAGRHLHDDETYCGYKNGGRQGNGGGQGNGSRQGNGGGQGNGSGRGNGGGWGRGCGRCWNS